MPPKKIWIDGKLVDFKDATVGVYDHGLLYGDGVFEGIRAYNGKLFEIDAHLRRLYESAKTIRLTIPHKPQDLKAAVLQTLAANNLTDCYVRLVVSRGDGFLGINPQKCATPRTIIIADSIELYPPEIYQNGMAIITSTIARNHPNTLSPRVKSLNYLNNILAKIEANDAGVSEALMLSTDGYVSECSADNIFIIRDGTVFTPTPSDGILEGITRAVILKLCQKHQIPAHERRLLRIDVYVADECFLTGTAAEIVPVTKIDHRPIGAGQVGPLTRKLASLFHAFVRET